MEPKKCANMYYFLVDSSTKYLMGSRDGDNGLAFYQGSVRFDVWNQYEIDVALRYLVEEADKSILVSEWQTPKGSSKYEHCKLIKSNLLGVEIPKGDLDASFVIFKDFNLGLSRFRDLMALRHKRFPIAYSFLYHLELRVFLLCIQRFDRFVVSELERWNLGCPNLSVFNYPPETRQVDVKEICDAFQHALGKKMSIKGLNNPENYIVCEGMIKVLWPRSDSRFEDDLKDFMAGVDSILIPGVDWKLKNHFLRCFWICFNLIVAGHPEPFKVLIEHTLLKSDMYQILCVLWKAEHLLKNRRKFKLYFDIRALVKYLTVTSAQFKDDVCRGSDSWVYDPSSISPLLRSVIEKKFQEEKRLPFEKLCAKYLQTPLSMIISIRGLFQHLDENDFEPASLFCEVESKWGDFIPAIHAEMHRHDPKWRPRWMDGNAEETDEETEEWPEIDFKAPIETRQKQLKAQEQLEQPYELHVKGLDYYCVCDDTLRTSFSPYGRVLDARVKYDRFTGKHLGYGFVTMSNVHDGRRAMNELDGTFLEGRRITVTESDRQRQR